MNRIICMCEIKMPKICISWNYVHLNIIVLMVSFRFSFINSWTCFLWLCGEHFLFEFSWAIAMWQAIVIWKIVIVCVCVCVDGEYSRECCIQVAFRCCNTDWDTQWHMSAVNLHLFVSLYNCNNDAWTNQRDVKSQYTYTYTVHCEFVIAVVVGRLFQFLSEIYPFGSQRVEQHTHVHCTHMNLNKQKMCAWMCSNGRGTSNKKYSLHSTELESDEKEERRKKKHTPIRTYPQTKRCKRNHSVLHACIYMFRMFLPIWCVLCAPHRRNVAYVNNVQMASSECLWMRILYTLSFTYTYT